MRGDDALVDLGQETAVRAELLLEVAVGMELLRPLEERVANLVGRRGARDAEHLEVVERRQRAREIADLALEGVRQVDADARPRSLSRSRVALVARAHPVSTSMRMSDAQTVTEPIGEARAEVERAGRVEAPVARLSCSAGDQELEDRFLRVQPVLGLVEDDRAVRLEDVGGDLLAAVRGQAVQERARPRAPRRRAPR